MLNHQGVADYFEENFPAGVHRLVSLNTIDIDHFNRTNHTLGHDGGDKVLRKIAEVTKLIFAKRIVWRVGGRFAITLPDQSGEEAYVMAEKLRSLVPRVRFDEFPRFNN